MRAFYQLLLIGLAGALCCPASTQATSLVWHSRTLPGKFYLYDAAYGNGTYLALAGADTGPKMLTSPDGVAWSAHPAPTNTTFESVAFSDGAFWTATDNGIYRSPDGIQWEQVLNAYVSPYQPAVAARDGRVLVVSGSGRIFSSTNNGVSWTSYVTNSGGLTPFAAIGNGLFVAVANYFLDGNARARVLVSADGATWDAVELTQFNTISGLLFVNGLFVATANLWGANEICTAAVLTSSDGRTWSPSITIGSGDSFDLAYGGGLFLVVNNPQYAFDRTFVWCSTNLQNWEAQSRVPGAPDISRLAYGGGTFLAMGTYVSLDYRTTNLLQSDFIEPVPPTIAIHPKSTGVYEGKTARFWVGAFGTPPLFYQWRKDGKTIDWVTEPVLTITNAGAADIGDYDVVVTNSVGRAVSQNAHLDVSWLTIRGGYIGLNLEGDVGSTVRIEYRDSAFGTNWLFLTNVVLTSAPFVWIDYESPDHPTRFYRAAWSQPAAGH